METEMHGNYMELSFRSIDIQEFVLKRVVKLEVLVILVYSKLSVNFLTVSCLLRYALQIFSLECVKIRITSQLLVRFSNKKQQGKRLSILSVFCFCVDQPKNVLEN